MRYDQIQAKLWNECVALNDKYEPGASLVIDEKEYSIAFPFNVISNGIKANLYNPKTHKHEEKIVCVLSRENGQTKWSTIV